MPRQDQAAAMRPADEAPAGLDLGPLPRLTGYVLRRAQVAVFEDFITALAGLDLRPAQYSVLLVIDRNPGSTQTAVATALGIQRANFVALLDGLERRGLARRQASPLDRRSHALVLTAGGKDLLARAHGLVAEHERRVRRWAGGGEMEPLFATLEGLVSAADRD